MQKKEGGKRNQPMERKNQKDELNAILFCICIKSNMRSSDLSLQIALPVKKKTPSASRPACNINKLLFRQVLKPDCSHNNENGDKAE